MAHVLELYRDRLVLDQSAIDYVRRTFPAGVGGPDTTIVLAGREVVVPAGTTFELTGISLLILADRFDGAGSTIRLLPADDGFGPSCGIAIRCQELLGGRFELPGGRGRPGADGAAGQQGVARGRGGPGSNGADGKAGGTVNILSVTDQVGGGAAADLQLLAPGGTGGAGGRGGGGATWREQVPKPNGGGVLVWKEFTGPQGADGEPGTDGAAGHIAVRSCSDAELLAHWQMLAPTWALYRLRVGEYCVRAYNGADLARKPLLDRAVRDYEVAAALNAATAPAANARLAQLRAGMTAVGLPRFGDVLPDFERYEQIVTRFFPLVDSAYQSALTMLDQQGDLGRKTNELQREIATAAGLVVALKDEAKASELATKRCTMQRETIEQRIASLTATLNVKKRELENAEVNLFGAVVGTVAVVAAAASAVVSMGATLVPAIQAIAAVGSVLASSDLLAIGKEAFAPKGQQPILDKLEQNAEGLTGMVRVAKDKVPTLLSFPKTLRDLWNADVDDQEYRQLLIQATELAHEQLLAQLSVGQAELEQHAAQTRQTVALQTRDAAQQELNRLANDAATLGRAAIALVRLAQQYSDLLARYIFRAARAVEIYTLSDLSALLRFDYGYVHPDLEENALAGISSFVDLIAHYRRSWGEMVELLAYRARFDQHFEVGDWVFDFHRCSFSATADLEALRQNRRLQFTVRIEDLPVSRAEAKVETMFVALVGATALANAVSCVIEHAGIYTERSIDGAEIAMALAPHRAIVDAKIEALSAMGGIATGTSSTASFWGRGVASTWTLSIEEDVLLANKIDLTQLSEIQVWIGYRSLLRTPSHRALVGLPADDTRVREANQSANFVLRKGVKFRLVPNGGLPAGGQNGTVITLPDGALEQFPFGGDVEA